MSVRDPYEERLFCALALDPIHVGTGGYRLGEVDLTIVREPGSNLPKIPGSSLEGTARAYTALAIDADHDRPASEARYRRYQYDAGEQRIKWLSCAGKGGADGSEHCGEIDCPVCVAYGFTIGPQNRSFHGLAQFHDAHILFFPVHSMIGPVWVTSPQALRTAGVMDPPEISDRHLRAVDGLLPSAAGSRRRRGLNLGWLFLQAAEESLQADPLWSRLGLPAELSTLKQRLILLPEYLFGLVVDSNLEVRTSVSIDPETGAAEDKGLFTYEAIPRGTVLQFSVVYHNPQHFVFPVWNAAQRRVEPQLLEGRSFDWLHGNVRAGLDLMQYLGVGGMNTRGFGRMRVWEMAPSQGGH